MPSAVPHAFRFILVEPLYGGNVGSAARVLKNFGFGRLDLVDPHEGADHAEAMKMAVDAKDLLAASKTHATLDAALDGAATVVGTSRRMGKQRQPHYALHELAPTLAGFALRGEVAILFGREDSGMSDADLDLCTHLAYIPTSEAYPALNLAQTVAIAAYELSRAIGVDHPAPADAEDNELALADHVSREAMYAHLDEALYAIGFLKDGQVEGMMRRLRRMLGRAALTAGDVQVVRGIARQILWLAREAKLDIPERK
ncbi:MAG TPA: RNA methyltransferase [Candidatus Polarisedimenticolaceae bacterium]|nr:RNA methyltransferase [Candidatus Polarisedimenticolaceae bacterium]